MLINPLKLHVPTTLAEALRLYGSLENARLQAGGTFLLNSLKLFKRKGTKTPEHVISLRKIEELKKIEAGKDKLIIGSMTTINDIFDSPLLRNNWGILKTVCRNISTNPIRNMATIGGNLTCRYTWTEMPAVMIALEAELHFAGGTGQEQILSAEEFFQNNAKTDKILTKIVIRKDKNACLTSRQARIVYQRVKKTVFVDIPMLSLCIKTYLKGDSFSNTRVAVNNCVNFAQRDRVLEDFLNQSKITKNLPQEALDHLDPKIYDTRSDDYKKHMFRVSIKNAVKELIEKAK